MSKKTTVKKACLQRDARCDEEQQVLKFFIGLKLLGEKKRQRFLAYMLSLQEQSGENPSRKEAEQ